MGKNQNHVKVKINGAEYKFDRKYSLEEVIKHLGIRPEGIAMALNWNLVSKKELGEIIINDGDEIEIIRAVAGGC